MITKYKNIVAFLIIAFFLLVPFVVIKTLGADYEIFPAAIFPGGADRKPIGEEIELKSMQLVGKEQETNADKEIDVLYLFKRIIHIHHMAIIMNERHFGALTYEGYPAPENSMYAPYATEEDIEQTKRWLREGLREQNCKDSILMVRFTEIKLDGDTRKLKSETVIDERVLKLY